MQSLLNKTEKQCGDCSLCCKLLEITELDKRKDVWCNHAIPGSGCGIYSERPAPCRAFACYWLLNATMGPEWKPNVCKMVLVPEGKRRLAIYVDPGATRPWRKAPYFEQLKAWAAKALPTGGLVLVVERGISTLLLPDSEVELGVITKDDRIVLDRIATASGFNVIARVVSAAAANELGLGEVGWFNPGGRK